MNTTTLYSVEEAAAAIGMSPQRLRAAIRRGDVGAVQRGSRYLLSHTTIEHLTGARSGAGHVEVNLMNTGDWTLGRRDLTEHELGDFRTIWNEELAPLGRFGIEEQGFALVLGPAVAHLDWPLAGDRRVLVTVRGLDGTWTPESTVDPATAGDLLEYLADGLQDIRFLANAGADYEQIAERVGDLNHVALVASIAGDNAAVHLAPIPDDCPLEGVGLVYEPEAAA